MAHKDHLVPLSILAGCSIIAAGLYFGLRSQPTPGASPPISSGAQAAPPASAPPAQPTSPSPPAVTPPAMPAFPSMGAPASPGVPPEVQAAAEKAATEALLVEKRNTFIPRCWQPAISKQPEPAVAKFRFNMMFDAQGKEVGRGLHEDRSAIRADVAGCIRDQPLGLQISPPPGMPVNVTVPLELP